MLAQTYCVKAIIRSQVLFHILSNLHVYSSNTCSTAVLVAIHGGARKESNRINSNGKCLVSVLARKKK